LQAKTRPEDQRPEDERPEDQQPEDQRSPEARRKLTAKRDGRAGEGEGRC
jgi:hypothetical protein